jgi:hypothetical protein
LPGPRGPARPAKINPALPAGRAPGEAVPAAAGRAAPAEAGGLKLRQLLRSLALPQDDLSAALVRSARNFSLPLEPALLSRLRREALALNARRGGGHAESSALAAAAAAGKGAALGGEALERYARAIDPDYEPGGREPPEQGEGQASGGDSAPFRGQDGGGGRRDPPDREDSAGEIRRILGEALERAGGGGEESDPPTGFLNRLPDREGNFWIVYPFKINSEKLAICLSIWILLLCGDYSERGPAGGSVKEITVNAAGKERRWVFSITDPGGPGAKTRVSVSHPCAEAARKQLEKEIREVLGGFGGEAVLADGGGPFFFSDPGGFPSVEEEA